MHLALQPILLDKQTTATSPITMAVTRAVSHGRESVYQCPETHGGSDKEPISIACLYSKDASPRPLAWMQNERCADARKHARRYYTARSRVCSRAQYRGHAYELAAMALTAAAKAAGS